MPPSMALIVTLRDLNYRCIEQIFMVPKGFEPSKFDCICIDIVEIWFGIPNVQIRPLFNRVIYPPYDNSGALLFHVLYFYFVFVFVLIVQLVACLTADAGLASSKLS